MPSLRDIVIDWGGMYASPQFSSSLWGMGRN